MPVITAKARKAAPKKPQKEDFSEFLRIARERFKMAAAAEAEIRKEAVEDLNFRAGKQWPAEIQNQRENDARPCLTINRLPQFIRQVTNEARQNRPSIQANPIGDGSDRDLADIYEGLCRHIEVQSDSAVAYDTANDFMATMGWGYVRVTVDYEAEDSFDQEIYIKRVKNPFAVYFDPSCEEVDYSDAKWCFVVEKIPKDEYKEQYPGSELASLADFRSIGDTNPDWFPGGEVVVAEYFYYDNHKTKLFLLDDGTTIVGDNPPEGKEVIKSRDTELPIVRWVKMNAVEKLEERVWPGKYIPIVPFLGDEITVDGRRDLVGLVRFSRDPQRQYNYMRTALVENVALAPKSPFIAAEGQIMGHEQEWKQANVRNNAVLQYKPTALANGQPVPPPQRNTWEPPIQAITVAVEQSDNDLKATTGLYDASLGARGPEQSGKAILARQKQGETSIFNYQDNTARGVRHVARILVDLIPRIYDRPGRIVRIVNPDGTHKLVTLNKPITEGDVTKIYDVRTGKFDVNISTGPSYQSRRQEAAASILELIQHFPQIMQVAGDLLVGEMDWPKAAEVAKRLKAMLPQQLQDPEGKQAIPPEFQAQQQALIAQVQALQSIIQTKQLELESKERITAMNAEANIIVAELKAGASNAEKLAQLDMQAIQHRLDLLHQGLTLQAEQEHEIGMADKQADIARQQLAAQPAAQPKAA